jgi:hypothetical protein
MTWKPDLILYFLAQIPIYASCSGATSVYTSFKAVRERICGIYIYIYIYILYIYIYIYIWLWIYQKKGLISLHREMEKGPLHAR